MQPNRILFVDDEPNILRAFARQLRRVGEIVTACGPEPGLEALRTGGPFSVVVVDMQMPGMNGFEFLEQAKALQPNAVRIMLTGNADADTAERAAAQAGIFRFLLKPCDGERLMAVIADALAAYREVQAA